MSDADWDDLINAKRTAYEIAAAACILLVGGKLADAHRQAELFILAEREIALIGQREAVAS